MWSCTAMPSGLAISTIGLGFSMPACTGDILAPDIVQQHRVSLRKC
jgi:hypothetical protein